MEVENKPKIKKTLDQYSVLNIPRVFELSRMNSVDFELKLKIGSQAEIHAALSITTLIPEHVRTVLTEFQQIGTVQFEYELNIVAIAADFDMKSTSK